MKLLLEVKDEKSAFIMEVLKNFKDIKVKPLSDHKAEVIESIKVGIAEVNLIKAGKLKGIPANEVFDDL